MPNTATGTPAAPTIPQYRFRTGAAVSPWVSADQLKEAALRGELLHDSEIQQSGHAEWVPASNVRGLTFPAPAPATAPATAATEAASVVAAADAAAAAANSRHPRFATIRDLLAAYVNSEIEINLPDSTEFSSAHLCMVGGDHFEVTLESNRSRVFVPYTRIRVVWGIETSNSATLNYRESHKLTVELERK